MMQKLLRATATLALVWVVTGCGQDVGNDGVIVGGSCAVSSECAFESSCRTEAEFPGGYCSSRCSSDEDCPDGASCADILGGRCLVSCASDGDCREEYACTEWPARNDVVTVMICIGS